MTEIMSADDSEGSCQSVEGPLFVDRSEIVYKSGGVIKYVCRGCGCLITEHGKKEEKPKKNEQKSQSSQPVQGSPGGGASATIGGPRAGPRRSKMLRAVPN